MMERLLLGLVQLLLGLERIDGDLALQLRIALLILQLGVNVIQLILQLDLLILQLDLLEEAHDGLSRNVHYHGLGALSLCFGQHLRVVLLESAGTTAIWL